MTTFRRFAQRNRFGRHEFVTSKNFAPILNQNEFHGTKVFPRESSFGQFRFQLKPRLNVDRIHSKAIRNKF